MARANFSFTVIILIDGRWESFYLLKIYGTKEFLIIVRFVLPVPFCLVIGLS